jgi:cytochrome c553
MAVDLPALLRPTKAISGRSLAGSWSSRLAVVRKRAPWVQASAAFGVWGRVGGLQDGCHAHCKIRRFAPRCFTRRPPLKAFRMRMHSPQVLASLAPCSPAPLLPPKRKPSLPSRPDAAKGQELAATCLACHTADGTRGLPANPILQAQHPEYIVKQLTEFKGGKRKNAIMTGMAAPLAEEDMKHIAAFYRQQEAGGRRRRHKDTVALGEQIYRGGIAAKQVPACRLPQPQRRRHPGPVPAPGWPACRIYLQAQTAAFRSGRACQQCADDHHRRQDERRRDQGRGRLHGRAALGRSAIPHLRAGLVPALSLLWPL